jgi:hypothetical protein
MAGHGAKEAAAKKAAPKKVAARKATPKKAAPKISAAKKASPKKAAAMKLAALRPAEPSRSTAAKGRARREAMASPNKMVAAPGTPTTSMPHSSREPAHASGGSRAVAANSARTARPVTGVRGVIIQLDPVNSPVASLSEHPAIAALRRVPTAHFGSAILARITSMPAESLATIRLPRIRDTHSITLTVASVAEFRSPSWTPASMRRTSK